MASFDKRTSSLSGKISSRVRIRRKGFRDLIKTFSRKTDAKLWAEQTEASLNSGQTLRLIRRKIGDQISDKNIPRNHSRTAAKLLKLSL
jgi:hypothetical protein